MAFLIGTLERHHSELFEDDYPFYEADIVEEATREHLAKARNDDNYQVINLITKQFYNPKKNEWQKFKSLP